MTPYSPTEPRFISQQAAADRWGVSVDTIRRLVSSGKLAGYRLNGRVIRVEQTDVDRCFRLVPTAAEAGE